jgi:beta-lactamase class A
MARVSSVWLALTAAAALLVGTAAAQAPSSSPTDNLRQDTARRLEETARRVDGVLAYSILDVTSGERFDFRPNLVLPTASTIKLAILYELFHAADSGRLRLDETRPLDRRRAVPGGLLFELGTPSLSLRDHAVAMVVLSDNTATNVLIERLGMDAVNRSIAGLGLTDTKLRRYMIDLEAARRGNENVSTPAELARLLEAIRQGTGLSAASRDDMLAILKKEKIPVGPLGRGLPAGVEAATKIGELEGVRADVGIVFAKNRPYVFAAMSSYLADEGAGERAIEDLSRIAYGYFSRLGAGSSLGRLLGR